ncbi:MAG: phosphate ABC transporter permease PstA [Gammaproteobacteria bacterium]|nr:phosphate ABC transporter permease PstA [Gammaproteobacteria bacterium]
MKKWFAAGTPWIWLNAGAVSISVVMVVGLLLLIAVRGLGHFWPADVQQYRYHDQGKTVRLIGEQVSEELISSGLLRESGQTVADDRESVKRYLLKIGNRDIGGLDFVWITELGIEEQSQPDALMVLERREWGNFYGYLKQVKERGQLVSSKQSLWSELQQRLQRVSHFYERIEKIQKSEIGAVNYQLERLRLQARSYELNGGSTPAEQSELASERQRLNVEYELLQKELNQLLHQVNRDSLVAEVMSGETVEISLQKIVQAYRPNEMNVLQKLGFYFASIGSFISNDPREANTEGGIFPAIFGTVMMVLLMAIMVTPLGVIAALYLREYAHQGFVTRAIRIAVNNLAGVPSIVYGIFGLGFFVYFLGGNIDQLFFPEAAPAPTFGTPGLLWASLTLALLTLPVVIVATEEGLSRIPRSIREGSLALGATKAETLWHTVLPMASPAIMTGLILAIARAAGEVAPLMLVGVVKLAPTLPLDGNFPFLHMERQFMHLGFHIYDVGFQSPNVEAARPLVYATALLLVLVIIMLNLTAIAIRNRLREKFRSLEN